MKPCFSYFAIASVFFCFFSFAQEDISLLKRLYYEASGYKDSMENIKSSQRDINGDGVKEVIIYHSKWDCDSGGCTGIVFFRNNNDYCVIGSGDVAKFEAIKNKPREYKCLDGEEGALIGDNGEQKLIERVVADPYSQSAFIINSLLDQQTIYFSIKSLVDDIDVLGVEANKGDCGLHIDSAAMFPVKLKYGQNFKFIVMHCSKLLELKIKTNYGDYHYDHVPIESDDFPT